MNWQNIPRQETVIKKAIVPKLDALFFFDYIQIELTLLAYYMAALGDTSMVKALESGLDMHTESAKAALGLERDLSDAERQVGKVLNFSLVYGGGRPTIMRQLEVSWPAAGKLLAGFHKRWPGVQILSDAIQRQSQKNGYIKTLWGRHLHPGSPHKALNALVQGCAADLMRSSIVKTHGYFKEQGLESHVVSTIHDELILDVAFPESPIVVEEVPRLMDHGPVSEVVPIRVDIGWSTTNWATKETFVG